MSVSTHIYGITPPNAKSREMKAVWDACLKAEVRIPDEVWGFFNGENPESNSSTAIELTRECVSSFTRDGSAEYYVDTSKLPPGVTIIKFANCW